MADAPSAARSSTRAATWVVTWLCCAQPRKLWVLGLFTALILGAAATSLGLSAREDIRALIPDGDKRLAIEFALLRDAPFLNTLNITVGGPGSDPQAAATALARALGTPVNSRPNHGAAPIFSFVSTGPGSFSPRDLPRLLDALPALLSPERLAAWDARLDEDGVRSALADAQRLLLGPMGPALRGLVARDPLGLHRLFLEDLAPAGATGQNGNGMRGLPVRDGFFRDATGNYSLVLAKPAAAMTDAAASAAVMETVRAALAALPPGTEHIVTGSFRHSEANAAVIKDDLHRVLPVSMLLMAVLFLVFLRHVRAAVILAVPFAALAVAGAATAAVYGSVSGIVLGFGSVILGITADYAIHTYYAVTRAADRESGLIALYPSLLAGGCTTAFAFAALFFSAIPAIRQLGVFGLAGITTALTAALLVLPLILTSGGRAEEEAGTRKRGQNEIWAGMRTGVRAKPFRIAILAAALVLLTAGASLTLRFDGDIRNLAYTAPEIAEDEARAKATWSLPHEGAFVAVSTDGTEEGREDARLRNERVLEIMDAAAVTSTSLAPFLPSRQRQARNTAAWRDLWATRGAAILTALDAAAPEFGFAPEAFAPFRHWIQTPSGPTPEPDTGETPETQARPESGPGLLHALLASETAEHTRLYTLVPELNGDTGAGLIRELEAAGARYVSGNVFRADMTAAMSGDIFRFCLLTVMLVVLAVALLFRSPLRCAAVLLPALTGLAFTVSFFRIFGIAVTMFHAVALPLVVALSVDYGIFMQAVIEGRMAGHGKNGVLLSALTTLAGFGVLLLARHPALFSLGLAVSGGIAAAFIAAVWVQPRLFQKVKEA